LAADQGEAAVADFSEVIRLVPDDPEAYYQRSLAYERLGKGKESAEDRSHARGIDLQDAALLRQHVDTLRMPEMVRTEPLKKKPAVEPDDQPNYEDPFDARETWSKESDSALDRPLLAPLTGNTGVGTDSPSIVGKLSPFDSSIFDSPLVPRPAKAPAKDGFESDDEKESPKPGATSHQSGQSVRDDAAARRFGPAADPEPIRIHGRPPGYDPRPGRGTSSDELGAADATRQPKYPTARLNFMSPLVGHTGAGKPGSTNPGMRSPTNQPQSGLSNLAQPQSGADLRQVIEPQLRGFTPDTPALPRVGPLVGPAPSVSGRPPQPGPLQFGPLQSGPPKLGPPPSGR
jgi:hypothetical protein